MSFYCALGRSSEIKVLKTKQRDKGCGNGTADVYGEWDEWVVVAVAVALGWPGTEGEGY